MKYRCIAESRGKLSVKRACAALRVRESGYYAWKQRREDATAKAEERLWVSRIEQVFEHSRKTYGSPRITAALRQQGWRCNRKRIARLMRKHGMVARQKRRFKRTTRVDPQHPVVANVLQQDFHANRPDEKWLSDFTYIPTAQGWLYLAVVLDTYSRKIVGWAMSETMHVTLVMDALRMALRQRRPQTLLHHSDRGSQYTSAPYRQLLADHRITPSMSGSGNCYDNAMVESFFATLKTECAARPFVDRAVARASLFAYIEGWYNRHRLHSSIGYLSPDAFEHAFALDN